MGAPVAGPCATCDRCCSDRVRNGCSMQARKLTDQVSVAPQITADDIAEAAAAGFKSIICHRPDGEEAGQPQYQEIAVAAEKAGLTVRYQPVVSGQMQEGDADTFATLIEDLPKPILAYCRTGTRCTALWSLAQAGEYAPDEIISRAAEAGYDMRGLLPAITARSRAKAGQ